MYVCGACMVCVCMLYGACVVCMYVCDAYMCVVHMCVGGCMACVYMHVSSCDCVYVTCVCFQNLLLSITSQACHSKEAL